ncbi:vicilin-like seed storage protein At2g18540 [Eutrema salsugineum]|uniref:vicilin-like seed storage protein At2g18540 n=1 Tax=Eutrema salsugineum TaxID=72664 RepID=UPI000CECEA3C|nr:vicilin-like seed storage protein At2g18540 [Eutrema salsugineum]XP_024005374.1 vicilin-like seed storage protein At2g18540 [Eutrema salsugineum]
MDLETENRIASILLREAAELRRQAEKEGIRAYLEKPNVRHRPNSRFLTATVLGIQQANKAVETNEMWSLRSEERLKRKSREESSSGQSEQNKRRSFVQRCNSVDKNVATPSSSSSSRSRNKGWQSEEDDEGLGDVEIANFLQSRVKRGRGSVGPRMDETVPCLPVKEPSRTSDTGDRKLVLQSERSRLRHETDSSSSSEEVVHGRTRRKRKEHKKKLCKKHKSKEKSRDREKRKHCRD